MHLLASSSSLSLSPSLPSSFPRPSLHLHLHFPSQTTQLRLHTPPPLSCSLNSSSSSSYVEQSASSSQVFLQYYTGAFTVHCCNSTTLLLELLTAVGFKHVDEPDAEWLAVLQSLLGCWISHSLGRGCWKRVFLLPACQQKCFFDHCKLPNSRFGFLTITSTCSSMWSRKISLLLIYNWLQVTVDIDSMNC